MAEPGDPIARFIDALARAEQSEPDVASAATLATVDADGKPSARVILIRGVDEQGFDFYTNYESRKAQHLTGNPHAALCVHWKSLGEQVRIEGPVARLSAAESDAYFASRPLESQLAAIASAQSKTLARRALLEERFEQLRAEHGDTPPARPDGWGGYRLAPERIEFWFHRDYRLHHRVLYEREGTSWRHRLLNP